MMSAKVKAKTKKRTKSAPKSVDPNCLFCGQTTDRLKYGRMYKLNDIYVHYYCLLLSSGLIQNGKDSDGILGFLEVDIRKELKRVSKLKCSYCKEMGANIGCSVKACKVSFHLPCGHKNDALSLFFDRFDSYCKNHRNKQTLDPNIEINEFCPICYEPVKFDEGIHVLTSPCCHKLTHRLCLQQQALSAGYFYKCPLCNNEDTFKQEMLKFGIFVPKQDASWEQEDNAFGELYQRYSRCDQNNCLCPHGRNHRDDTSSLWRLLICGTCGSKGTHWSCLARPHSSDVWICEDCQNISHNNSISEEDDDNDIKLINFVDNHSNSMNGSASQPIIKLPNNETNQLLEIEILDQTPNKRTKIRPEMKDIGIQCELVDINDLIDSEPFNNTDPIVFRNSIISVKNQVIDLSDSDDEDCVIITQIT